MKLTISNVLAELEKATEKYQVLFAHRNLRIGLYRPGDRDDHSPHSQDEIYVVAMGSGRFVKEGNRQPCEVGEVLFVPAGVAHYFENFTDDFSVWVFFTGLKAAKPCNYSSQNSGEGARRAGSWPSYLSPMPNSIIWSPENSRENVSN